MAHDSLPDGVVVIYGLVDPITSQLHYVGKTQYRLSKRRRQHINHSKNRALGAWVVKLRSNNSLPVVFEIERTTIEAWQEAERFWISYFRGLGAQLFNVVEGGGSTVTHSPEVRRRIAARQREWLDNPENIERLRKIGEDGWKDPGYRARTMAAGRAAITPELRARRSRDKLRDWAENPLYRARWKAAQAKIDRSGIAKRFWSRPEYRAKRNESNARRRERGPWVSEQQKQKLKATWTPERRAAQAARLSEQRARKDRTRCTVGHSLVGDNAYVAPGGKVTCKKCRATWARAHRAKKQLAIQQTSRQLIRSL